MKWIDTHAHIYLPEFSDDRQQIVQRAEDAGIGKIFLPNVDLSTANDLLDLCDRYPDLFYPMMGLHPCSVSEQWTSELDQLYAILTQSNRQFYAVGEIGLDLYWDKSTLVQQIKAFHRQIEWAMSLDLPVVIHVREAFDESFSVVDQYPNLRGVFHCFTGTTAQAEWIQSRNMYVGLGGVSTFKNGGMEAVIPHLNQRLVVLETDAPYLAPVPFRGKRNESSYIPLIGKRIAELWKCPLEDVMRITTENAQTLFQHG